MKRDMVCAAALLALASGALAQGVQVRGVVGGGFTFGGDTLATVHYDNNNYGSDDVKVHAGGLIAFNAGVDLQFTDMVSGQVLLGYHVDRASASKTAISIAQRAKPLPRRVSRIVLCSISGTSSAPISAGA